MPSAGRGNSDQGGRGVILFLHGEQEAWAEAHHCWSALCHALKGHQQRFIAFPSPMWRTEGSFNALSCNGPPLSRVRYVCNMVTLQARSASLAGGGAPLVHARRRRQCSCRSRSPDPVGMCRVHWQATLCWMCVLRLQWLSSLLSWLALHTLIANAIGVLPRSGVD